MTTPVGQQPEARQQLASRLAEVEAAIAETLKRMPAHSVKPPIMLELFALEEERDQLRQTISAAGPQHRD